AFVDRRSPKLRGRFHQRLKCTHTKLHRHINMKKIFIALLASTLFACGGGSSERDTDLTKYTPENVPEHLREDFEAMLLQEHFEAASAIHGLFKIEIDGDETYVSIPTNSSSLSGYDGFSITAYTYMGDVFDASGSCYLPPDSDGLNW